MITSFRMYNAAPAAAAAWRALFEPVFDELGLRIEVVEHKWPQPIESLWSDASLCCAFMCGWPYAHADGMQAIVAPVPSLPRYAGAPRYCSEFLARANSGWTRLEDAFGHRFGWMACNSQSGFNAPRAHLARFASRERPALFSEVLGPLGNPATSLDALAEGKVDLVALDGFYLDLLRHHQPERLEGTRMIATTAWTAIPPLVAAPAIDAGIVQRLRARLTSLHEEARYQPILQAALLERFVPVERHAYVELVNLEARAIASGYADIR